MKVVGLISGGKDSFFNLVYCSLLGHDIVALANLYPAPESGKDELDSYMYQTVGHDTIPLYTECMAGLPLYRQPIRRSSKAIGADYTPNPADEVEDLHDLLARVQADIPDVKGVSVGAILSNYQRVRVENVCGRLSLTPLAFLWRRNQRELLEEMVGAHMECILIKVAGMGLNAKHLSRTLGDLYPHLCQLNTLYGSHICGEGGEFETMTLDAPIFSRRIVIDESEVIVHSDDDFAPVSYIRVLKAHTEPKDPADIGLSPDTREMLLASMNKTPMLPDLEARWKAAQATPKPPPTRHPTPDPHSPISLPPFIPTLTSPSPWRYLSATTMADSDHPPPTLAIEEETRIIMDSLQARLAAAGLALRDLVILHLYIADMSHFQQINSVYKQYFGLNPPTRICVAVPLSRDRRLQIDAVAYASGPESLDRDVMHVQGISNWAPANIGPYSQTVKIRDSIFIAGQVPLNPTTLLPIPASSVLGESLLTLVHLESILGALIPETLQNDSRYAADLPLTRLLSHVTVGFLIVYYTGVNDKSCLEWLLAQVLSASDLAQVCFCLVTSLPRGVQVEMELFALSRFEPAADPSESTDVPASTSIHGVWLIRSGHETQDLAAYSAEMAKSGLMSGSARVFWAGPVTSVPTVSHNSSAFAWTIVPVLSAGGVGPEAVAGVVVYQGHKCI